MTGFLRITKSTFLTSLTCPRMGWFSLNQNQEKGGRGGEGQDDGAHFWQNEGRYVEKLAREHFPDGVMVEGRAGKKTAEETTKLLEENRTVFEAVIQSGPLTTRPDILVPLGGGKWKLIEIKSALAKPSSSSRYLHDVAYTKMVLQRNGLKISECSLLLINPSFTLPSSPFSSSSPSPSPSSPLFQEIDVTNQIKFYSLTLSRQAPSIISTLSSPSLPSLPPFSTTCRSCSFFSSCQGEGVSFPISQLSSLSSSRLLSWWGEGVRDVRELGETRKKSLTKLQKIVVESIEKDEMVIKEGIKDELLALAGEKKPKKKKKTKKEVKEQHQEEQQEKQVWPIFFLDFESFMLPVPTFPNDPPYTPILSQFSLHIAPSPSHPIQHIDHIVPPQEDGRERIAHLLIEALSPPPSDPSLPPLSSPILVWGAAFEKARIRDLAERFPSLSSPLLSLLPRIVDLLPICRSHLHHPSMGGKFNLKSVTNSILPPKFSYKNLKVAEGGAAMMAYGDAVRRMGEGGEGEGEEWGKVERDLKEYCKHDTRVMVEILRVLVEKCGVGPQLGPVVEDEEK